MTFRDNNNDDDCWLCAGDDHDETRSNNRCSSSDSRIIYSYSHDRSNSSSSIHNNNNNSNNSNNNSNSNSTTRVQQRQRRSRRVREGRIVTIRRILPLTKPRTYLHASVYLAFEHFNERNGIILPFLPDRLNDCDFSFSWEFIHCPVEEQLGSARKFLQENNKVCHRHGYDNNKNNHRRSRTCPPINDDIHDDIDDDINEDDDTDDLKNVIESCPPFAVLGGLSMLGDAYRVPHLSGAYSPHSYLGEESLSAIIIPVHTGIGQAIAVYLADFLKVSHTAIVYSTSGWGVRIHSDTVLALQQRNITVLSLPVVAEGHAENAIEQLAASQYKYVVFLYSFIDKLELFELAYSYKVMGYPGYTWLFGGGTTDELVGRTFTTTKPNLAKALHGAAYFRPQTPTHPSFQKAMLHFATNTTMQQQFIQHFQQPEIFHQYNFTSPFISLFTYYAYETVMALGIAACESPGLFTGEQLYQSLLQTQFEGLTGTVSFDSKTHARSVPNLNFAVRNIVISVQQSTSTNFYFTSPVTSVVNITNHSIQQLQNFIYADNTTQQPLSLPLLVQDQNQIPNGVLIVALAFSGLVILASLGWMLWTYKHRNAPLVRASQPFFLCQLCIGTFIMGLSVIPSTFQEPIPHPLLHMGCMSIPWLLFTGFVTSFSALFAKAWRLNQLFQSGVSCRRSKIQPKQVLWPFCTLMLINFFLLTAWTVTDPIQWNRVDVSNYDSFGRSQESYGRCFLSGLPFSLPLVVVNSIPVVIALYQSWKARSLSDDFSESSYVGLSVFSIGETIILFIPVMIAAKDNPTAYCFLYSLLICILCLAILLPIFIPKFLKNAKWDQRSSKLSISRLTVGG